MSNPMTEEQKKTFTETCEKIKEHDGACVLDGGDVDCVDCPGHCEYNAGVACSQSGWGSSSTSKCAKRLASVTEWLTEHAPTNVEWTEPEAEISDQPELPSSVFGITCQVTDRLSEIKELLDECKKERAELIAERKQLNQVKKALP